MEDRELLELAAKAAGIVYTISPHGNLLAHEHPAGGEMRVWNPLVDDGDAFRLSVKLEMNVEYSRHWNAARAISNPSNGLKKEHWENTKAYDTLAATRRAITIAAAEIGKQLAQAEG